MALRAAENLAGLLALALCVTAMTWPWAKGFADAFPQHQDPPLHAWKVWHMAEAVLRGEVRPPGLDLNVCYPHSGSLYYESLYWPQGLAAAPVLAATRNPVLAFHCAYLFFWALSGVCFKSMMRALGAGRAAAWLGGLVFTVMPYRTGYVVEFNMQLCFGLPLVVRALAEWCRARSCARAVLAAAGGAVAFGLQAVSELYQAVFFAMGLPAVVLALGRGRWRQWLASRRFWGSLAVAALAGAVFAGLFLAPYAGQLGSSVSRGLREVSRHELEPFSYLASAKHMRWSALPSPAVKEREICVYPTLAVSLAAAWWLAGRFGRKWRRAGRLERVFRALRAALLAAFLAWTALGLAAGGLGAATPVYAWLPAAVAVLSLAIPAVAAPDGERGRLLDGLCGAAVFAFLMGLGPELSPLGGEWRLESPLYLALYRAFPFLQGFRVVARFAIVVLLFVVAAATLACDAALRAARRRGKRGGFALRALVGAGIALTLAESLPLPLSGTFDAVPPPLRILDALAERTGAPAVVVAFPGTGRNFDARTMFRIAGAHPDRLLVAGWGGALPWFTARHADNCRLALRGKPERWWRQLSMLWPECRVLLDRQALDQFAPDPERRNALLGILGSFAVQEDEDGPWSLWRLREASAGICVDKFIRRDLWLARPVVSFRVAPDPPSPARVAVELDDAPAASLDIPAGGAAFRLCLGPGHPDPVEPVHLRFRSDVPVRLEDFRCMPR